MRVHPKLPGPTLARPHCSEVGSPPSLPAPHEPPRGVAAHHCGHRGVAGAAGLRPVETGHRRFRCDGDGCAWEAGRDGWKKQKEDEEGEIRSGAEKKRGQEEEKLEEEEEEEAGKNRKKKQVNKRWNYKFHDLQ